MRVSLAVPVLVALGCTDPEGESIRSVEPVEDVTALLVLEVEVGHSAGSEFGYVDDVAVADDGGLYVLDTRARQVLWFDSAGVLVRALGGAGEGPAEFRSPVAVAIDGDEVRIWDIGLWRVTTFDGRGMLVATEPVPPRRESGWPAVVRYRGDGKWLYLDQEIETPGEAGVQVSGGMIRGVARLLSWTRGSPWVEIARFPGMEAALIEVDGDVGLTNAPFPAGPLWAPRSDSAVWYADSRSYTISRRGTGVDTTAVIAVDREGPIVTDSAWRRFVGGRSGDMARAEARERSRLRRPATHPVLTQLVTSREGELWVQLRSDDQSVSSEWHVYSFDGTPQFRVHLPGAFRIHAVARNWLVGDIRDSLDVQTVRRYRLDRTAAPTTRD